LSNGDWASINEDVTFSPRDGYQWKVGNEQVKKYKDRNGIEVMDGKVFFKIRPEDESKQKFLPFWSHFFDKDTYGTAETGKAELKQIFNGDHMGFETVKPINLIKKLLFHINRGKNEIILDFFAGSGTTGQAVLDLNDSDGGKRSFILCTNNENDIATKICYPRIEKTIKGYNTQKGEKVEGLGGNLKYFNIPRSME
jgi:adenine-specific DNA-methyltransferase